jgi:hypothetical protein
MGDWISEDFHPVQALFYGPTYLLMCWVAAFLRRSAFAARSRILLIAGAVLLTFWIALVGYVINPPAIFSDGIFVNGWNPFLDPSLPCQRRYS